MSDMILIGLNGRKQAGKNTIGTYLVERYGFRELSFAWKLKESAAALFGITPGMWDLYKNDTTTFITFETMLEGLHVGNKQTAREFLQRYGTEAHRDIFGYDFWVNALLSEFRHDSLADHYFFKNGKYVITDARFDNELTAIKNLNGEVWRVERESANQGDAHVSEADPDPSLIDVYIPNNGSFEELYETIDDLMETIE